MRDRAYSDTLYRWLYPGLLILILTGWFAYMLLVNGWHLFAEHWPVSAIMTIGSFVAGGTPAGGAAVAYPVFTKGLHIAGSDARTFGLMIQSVGMTMAAVMIVVRHIPILPRVVLWVSLGGLPGHILGTYWLIIPAPYPRLLFTFIATAFGIALFLSRWWLKLEPRTTLPTWHKSTLALLVGVGIVGGIIAANIGTGINLLTFIVLTLALGINEKISTPTTVIIMAVNSLIGCFLHTAISQDVGIVWEYWLVAVPIVIVGAPLGAIVTTKVTRDHLILFLLFLILLELVTTIWLVPFTPTSMVITAIAVAVATLLFAIMLRYRQRLPKIAAKATD